MQRQAALLRQHLLGGRKRVAGSLALPLLVNILGFKILQKKGIVNLMCLGTNQLPPVGNERTSRISGVYVSTFPFLKAKSAGDEM